METGLPMLYGKGGLILRCWGPVNCLCAGGWREWYFL